ncbi:reverse transcriptase domain-containing protein [Tanacetum coccineum]
MACPLPHTFDEITKFIDKDIIRQKALMELVVQYENASAAKSDFKKAYEKCYDITYESRALIDTFLKQESNKDYDMNLALYRNAANIENQIESKYDEEVLRQTLKEEARAEKEWEEKMKQEKAEYELFTLEFEVYTTNVDVGFGGCYVILSFDMITEEFKELKLRDTLAVDIISCMCISKWRKSLAVVLTETVAKKEVISVWMMDNGDKQLFTKKFTINMPDEVNVVLGFRKSGEPIIEMIRDHIVLEDLFVYEPIWGTSNVLEITVNRRFMPMGVLYGVTTLAWISKILVL